MNAQTLIDNRKNEILRLAALHGARSIQVFGSTVSGQPELANDIDFLVDLAEYGNLLVFFCRHALIAAGRGSIGASAGPGR